MNAEMPEASKTIFAAFSTIQQPMLKVTVRLLLAFTSTVLIIHSFTVFVWDEQTSDGTSECQYPQI